MSSLKIILLLSVSLILLTSCSSANASDNHIDYIEEKGWTVDRIMEKELFTIPTNQDAITTYLDNGLNIEEFSRYDKVYKQEFLLNEKCKTALSVILFTTEKEKIIGSLMKIEDATPGIGTFEGKSAFLKECKE